MKTNTLSPASDSKPSFFLSRRALAVLATASLALGFFSSAPLAATASTQVEVFYNGNTIATAVPASATVSRDQVPLPPAASVTGSRAGYSFSGWSLSPGGAPLIGSAYEFSSTANRLDLYAVWTTTIRYNTNGSSSGSLLGSKTSDTYRFGDNLTLPTAGTLAKTGYLFGGWMASSVSTTRITSYQSGSLDVGEPTLFAAWIKTVAFNANGALVGTNPAPLTYVAGGTRLRLPVASEMTLRRPGFDFVGWSRTSTGSVVSSGSSYVPADAQQTLFAIWKIQSSKAMAQVFFTHKKSTLSSAQKLKLKDLAAKLVGKSAITITVTSTRPKGASLTLGKARNTAVVNYLRSLGVAAKFVRANIIGPSRTASSTKNRNVSISATWTNPTVATN